MDTKSKQVFISYHTETGKDAVRTICAALEGARISCWYAPRNVGANYAQSIVEAIRECRVFLLVLNEGSNVSAHVLNEINCAFDRFKAHEDITLLPFRIDQCALSDDIYYYLGRIHIMDGVLPPTVAAGASACSGTGGSGVAAVGTGAVAEDFRACHRR